MFKKITQIYNAAHDAPLLINYNSGCLRFSHVCPTMFGVGTKLKCEYSIRPDSGFYGMDIIPSESIIKYYRNDNTIDVVRLNPIERLTAKFILRYFRDKYNLCNVWRVARDESDNITQRCCRDDDSRPEYKLRAGDDSLASYVNTWRHPMQTPGASVSYRARFRDVNMVMHGASAIATRQILKFFYYKNKLRMMMDAVRVQQHIFA